MFIKLHILLSLVIAIGWFVATKDVLTCNIVIMIEIKDLHKSYQVGKNSLHVLKGLNLNIQAGEMVSIMGSSGSGKSTLLNILGILDGYNSGSYHLNQTPIMKLTETKAAKLRNKYLGFVFQSFNLISYKNAAENVALPLYYQKVKRKERLRRAEELLDLVGLADRADHLPSELSGGQQQRVAIARALVSEPKVVLADEPTGALDSVTSNEVMNIFKQVNKKGITVILVTHENDIAERSDRIINLKDGEIVT